jgi:hypothetical protein
MPAVVTTDAQVCNLALGMVGQRQFFDDLEADDSPEAIVCRSLYGPQRDRLLLAYDWDFCTARATLALTEEERDGWDYAYAEPSDCIRLRYLWSGSSPPVAREHHIPHARELRDAKDGHLILTNLEGAKAVYSSNVVTPALWTADFVDALAWALAARLALALPVKPQVGLAMMQGAKVALLEAAARDANTGLSAVDPEGSSVRAR